MPTDDDPEQQSGEEPADEPAAQSDAVAGNDQPDEQSTEGTDQVEQQSDDQPTSEADQQTAEADVTPPDEGDQPTEQPVQVAEAGGEPADAGDGGGGGATQEVASDAVAAAGGTGTTKVGTRNLKVIAEFTEEGQKFIGDILIHVFESDNGQQGRLLFQTGGRLLPQGGAYPLIDREGEITVMGAIGVAGCNKSDSAQNTTDNRTAGEKTRDVKRRYQGVCRGCGAPTAARGGKGDAYAYCNCAARRSVVSPGAAGRNSKGCSWV